MSVERIFIKQLECSKSQPLKKPNTSMEQSRLVEQWKAKIIEKVEGSRETITITITITRREREREREIVVTERERGSVVEGGEDIESRNQYSDYYCSVYCKEQRLRFRRFLYRTCPTTWPTHSLFSILSSLFSILSSPFSINIRLRSDHHSLASCSIKIKSQPPKLLSLSL